MKIAFIGNFAYKKGSQVFKEIVLHYGDKHTWYIFGYVGDEDALTEISQYIKFIQPYEEGQLALLLKQHKISLALLLSIWPETFSKTFFEVISQEVPFICTNLGYPYTKMSSYPYFVSVNNGDVSLDEVINNIDTFDATKAKQEVIKLKKNFMRTYPDIRDKKVQIIEKYLNL